MFVVTQENNILINLDKIHTIYLCRNSDKEETYSICANVTDGEYEHNYILGKYKSRERAQWVFDRIIAALLAVMPVQDIRDYEKGGEKEGKTNA